MYVTFFYDKETWCAALARSAHQHPTLCQRGNGYYYENTAYIYHKGKFMHVLSDAVGDDTLLVSFSCHGFATL